jgi:hypothetical protein
MRRPLSGRDFNTLVESTVPFETRGNRRMITDAAVAGNPAARDFVDTFPYRLERDHSFQCFILRETDDRN